MHVPNIWGQGQIFAFSALDGNAYATSDFVGILSGDRIGIKFQSTIIRELAVVGIEPRMESLYFKAVTGDYICADTGEGEEIIILYYDTNTIVGRTSKESRAIVLVEGKVKVTEKGQMEIQDTGDGEFTAIATRGTQFSFAYGKTQKDAERKALAGLDADITAAAAKKLSYYDRYSIPDRARYKELYSKCISVMKTQLYSPEGKFEYIWSTPERVPHKDMWLWDSIFHALGFRHLDSRLAEGLVLDIFMNQFENGMIPHRANALICSSITQPPIIAWGAWKLYETSGNADFLKSVFQHNRKFLDWCYQNRVCSGQSLFTWDTNEEVFNRCDESGIDNSPRFDEDVRLLAIDFACYMANEMRYMSKIADVIGEDKQIYEKRFREIKEAVNHKLWDENDGFYYDYDMEHNRLHKVESFSSFLPLFAGLCDEKQAEKLVGWLSDPNTFCTEMPIPSISKKSQNFEKDMWRGPVWINYNYMIIEGLKNYGYSILAHEFTEKTLNGVNEWYKKTGVIFEFYDCDNEIAPYKLDRKGIVVEPYDIRIKLQSIRDFGWSCTLVSDLIVSQLTIV